MQGRVVRWLLPFALVAVAGVGTAMAMNASTGSSSGTVKTAMTSKYGMVLVSSKGWTLYRYTPDKKGVNTCTGLCAKYWSAYLIKASTRPTAGAGATNSLIGTIKRAHGMAQITYAGFPLYTYTGDHKAGDISGEGFQHIWYVVNPKGAMVTHAVAAKPPTTTATTTTKTGWG
jgi:predicted lipoprotein with Yx(FWY)xxD motif